jgi:hypothetical protein
MVAEAQSKAIGKRIAKDLSKENMVRLTLRTYHRTSTEGFGPQSED